MLQRIQTVYLAFVIIGCIIISMFSLFSVTVTDGIYQLSVIKTSFLSQSKTTDLSFNFPLMIINALVALITLVTIVRYNDRKLQVKMINIVLLLVVIFIGVLILDYRQLADLSGSANSSINPVLIIVPIHIVLLLLARNAIKKDEALVRSADRLR